MEQNSDEIPCLNCPTLTDSTWCKNCWTELTTSDKWYIVGYLGAFLFPAKPKLDDAEYMKEYFRAYEMGCADRLGLSS